MGFAKSKGKGIALACQIAGVTPKRLLQMDELERRLLMESAQQLEKWRWEQLGKMLGG